MNHGVLNLFLYFKDLIVDRSAFDKIMEAVVYQHSVGSAPEANTYPIKTHKAEEAFEALLALVVVPV
jgi:succinate dehydrogenase/fumarate reductase-like Fe-S protein